jgi:hypothetical protein
LKNTRTQGSSTDKKGYRFFWLWTIGYEQIYVANQIRINIWMVMRPIVSTKALIPDDRF